MNQQKEDATIPALIGVCRFRFGTDGEGITTLVGFQGCPLRCKYCLNPQSIDPSAKGRYVTPKELYQVLVKDELYFLGTGGGITFGGGEPLLHIDYIQELVNLGIGRWKISVETSLNVPLESVEQIASFADLLIVDVKDLNPHIYKKYTGGCLDPVVANLKWLVSNNHKNKVVIRLPLIPNYNTNRDRKVSEDMLLNFGFDKFERFTYKTTSYYERKRTL